MDTKSLMRSRVREAVRSREKKIQSPLVRYNDSGQPVCNLCNTTVKSESLWPAHTASRQHKTAVEEYKAKAAAVHGPSPSEPPRAAVETSVPQPRRASELPVDFFDARPGSSSQAPGSGQPSAKRVKENPSPQAPAESSKQTPAAAAGSLPKGFFDDSNADSRARGIEPVKISIQDEYDQFKKSINEDVKEVDVRLEEEEFEAAEDREELEQLEQRTLRERIQAIRKRQEERAVAAANAKASVPEEPSEDDDSSDESDEDKLFVDWRAKHL